MPSWISNIRRTRGSTGGSIITRARFLSPEDAEHFKRDHSGQKLFDPSFRSCTMFIATVAREKFGFRRADLAELVEWADIIDGAQYASAQEAVELRAPAMQLTLVIESAQGFGNHPQDHPLDAAPQRWARSCCEPEIQRFVHAAVRAPYPVDRHNSQARAAASNGVIFFDLVDEDLEGYNKFIPYYLFPDSTYTVSVSTSSFRTKVSVGSNPWAPEAPSAQPGDHLRALRRRRAPARGRNQLRDRRDRTGPDGGGGDSAGTRIMVLRLFSSSVLRFMCSRL